MSGAPAYEGQAMIALSCGNAQYCHSSNAVDRFGATVDLDLDLYPATLDDSPAVEGTERLARAQANAIEFAQDIYCDVDAKRMPPFGEATLVAHANTPRYRSESGEPLPFVDSFEGLEILKNWLACGAPVVERTTPRPAGTPEVGAIVPMLSE